MFFKKMDTNICELCVQENPGLQWVIGGSCVTIYDLCHVVQQLKSHASTFSWAAVSRQLGLPKSATSASFTLKRKYEQYIQPYESRLVYDAPQTQINSLVSYLKQRLMVNRLSDKLVIVPNIRFKRRKAEMLSSQFLRNLQFHTTKKPEDQVTNSAEHAQQVLEFCNDAQPFTDESIADLLERLDGVVSLTVGPLTYLTVAPNFSNLRLSLRRLIIYDLPSHLVEEVYRMVAESLPNLYTLSILASSYYTITPFHDNEASTSIQKPSFLLDTAIW